MPEVTIPEFITVHLGDPDTQARNITIPFDKYIKNVASSEIYPTWPESSLRANILAQITFALNRIYTEWYRSKGYDFDITNSTRYDQKFIEDRDVFDNIVKIVDQIFNDYIVKQGNVVPHFTQYCDGRQVNCEGLSQWGTVELANQGLPPYEILKTYYGDDINIVYDAPLREPIPSYPGVPLRLGNFSEDVRIIQRQLNRISDNYPAIPKIPNTNGVFNLQTEASVKKFQEIFNLNVDGIVGKATWYKIKEIYNGIKRLGELYSEGLTFDEVSRLYAKVLKQGDTGEQVGLIQYYLAIIGYFDNNIPMISVDRIYGPSTTDAVLAFQKEYNLAQDGQVGRETFNKITEVYNDLRQNPSQSFQAVSNEIFPGRFLSLGMTGDDITLLQQLLRSITAKDNTLPQVEVTGEYDKPTENAVRTIQTRYNITPNGVVGPLTWSRIILLSKEQ